MPSRPRPVTLREVARAAGVSTASASRALAPGNSVGPDLHQRIRAAAERLGYTPNFAARSLAAQRSGLVGVMVGVSGEVLIAPALAAFERRLADAGFGVMLAATRETPALSLAALRALFSRGVEALLLAEPGHPHELAEALRQRGLPWMAIAEPLDGRELAVDLGRRRGAELAAHYLLGLGHRRIGVIATGEATAAGLSKVLRDSGVPPLDNGFLQASDLDMAQAGLRALRWRQDPATAVICGSDLHALAALRACFGLGLSVPQEVSLIGFGDTALARQALPALTSLRIPGARIGVSLAEGLLRSVEHGGSPAPVETPVKLVVRESTGPAPR